MAHSPLSSARSSTGCGPATRKACPQHDYIPLFALLGSQLTNDEVTPHRRRAGGFSADPESAEAIKKAIAAVTDTTADTTPTSTGSARTSRRAAGRWPGPNTPASGTLRATNQGSSRPSRVKVPVGPPFGKVTAHTTLAAPWASGRSAACPGRRRSAYQPGQTALTRMPSRYSSPASSPGQRVERRLGDAVGRAAAAHQRDRAALARHVDDARPRRPSAAAAAAPGSPATRRTGSRRAPPPPGTGRWCPRSPTGRARSRRCSRSRRPGRTARVTHSASCSMFTELSTSMWAGMTRSPSGSSSLAASSAWRRSLEPSTTT